MIYTRPLAIFTFILTLAPAFADEGKFALGAASTAPPAVLSEPVQKLLTNKSLQFVDGDGKAVADVWMRLEIPADATAGQIKAGVTYREVKQSEILGAIQFHREWSDYRKQKIPAGVYTMRLGYMPTDGKHTADVAEFQDFVVLIAAKVDKATALLDVKAMQEIAGDSIGSGHPGVFMLAPHPKPGPMPTVQARPKSHWVLQSRADLVVDGKKTGTAFGIAINLVGHSPAE